MTALILLPGVGWETARRRAFLWGLLPSLAVLLLITLVPALALLVASFTPLSLTDAAATFHFNDPLVNYRHLLEDERFLRSIATQLRLSVSSVALQLAVGLGLALLLNGRSRLLGATRTAFLIPMVLPPIVVALIWKIMYTPDVSPFHRALEAVGLPVRSLIANPDMALWAISLADTWQWFPFTMLMVLAALQMVPDEPLEPGRRQPLAAVPIHRLAAHPAGAGGVRPVPADRQLQGLSTDLCADRRWARHSDRGDQLLRLHPGLQFLLLGLRQRHRHGDPRGRLRAQLAGRPTRMERP